MSTPSRRLDFMSKEDEGQTLDTTGLQTTTPVVTCHNHISPSEVPHIGMEFVTEEEAYQFYLTYAKKVGFGTKKHKIHKNKNGKISSRIFCCSAEGRRGEDKRNVNVKAPRPLTRFDCKARMKICLNSNEKYRVDDFISEHTHYLVSPRKTHLFRAHRGVDEAHAVEIEMSECVGIAPKVAHDLMIKTADSRESLGFNGQDYKNYLRSKRTKTMEVGDTGGVLEYLQEMQVKDPNSSYSIQVDEDDMITNIFWADGRMKADYADFGDVVSFDTTYRKYTESRPLALFVGVNHHKQTIVFGGSLLYDETIPTFQWLFDTFASTMGGKKPVTILTDQDHAMANALASAWPETHHRLCIWHIYQNATSHLCCVFQKSKEFAHDFARCLYDFEEEDEFLDEWNKMLVKYDLVENDWLKRMFRLKEKWALVYGRQHFCADITTTQRSESINSVVKSSKTNLRMFFKRFEQLIESHRYAELKADFSASTSAPVLSFPTQLLKHAASLYTPEVFKVFHNELLKAYDCVDLVHCTSGFETEYHVSYLGITKHHVVKYSSLDTTVSCSCRKFEFVGVLCSHTLKVLTTNHLFKLPEQYVLKRWTKNAKAGGSCSGMNSTMSDELDPKTMLSFRYRDLSMFFNNLVTRASETEETYIMVKDAFVKTAEMVVEHRRSNKRVRED